MNNPRRPARVIVRTDDPALRKLIVDRLAGPGDLDVAQDGAGPDRHDDDKAVVIVEAEYAESQLTPRELEVIALLADGLANKEIAARLSISPHTAKFHVESLLRKLNASNRAEAVRKGIRQGMIGV
jgi:DNA-binding CsgD family transcriptional regulator